MALRVNPYIEGITPVEHGGTGWAGLKDADGMVDFSTCCNPYGPSADVRRALRKVDIAGYPDPRSAELVKSLSQNLGIAAANIIAGSGSTEIIRLAALAYLAPGDRVVIPSPTYGEYELASRLVGAEVVKYNLREDRDFRLDPDGFMSFARRYNPRAIFLCNPNNPTGYFAGRADFEKILSAFSNTLVVLDEAYVAFTEDAWSSLELLHYDNLLVIRSLTKDHGLAGLRIGYAAGSKDIISAMRKVLPPWNVNAVAQLAGVAELSAEPGIERQLARLRSAKRYLEKSFRRLGFKLIPSQTIFLLVRTGAASGFKQKLLLRGCLVRDCTSFGLPDYIRVSARGMTDCRRLINAVEEVVNTT